MEFDTDRPEILDGIGKTVRFRCAQEFPGVPWGEMEALSPFEVPCYCPSGDHEVHWETDQIVRDAVEFRDKELAGFFGCTESEIFNADQNECRKYDAFLATASQDTLNKYAFFNRTESEADFDHWGGMPYWTPEEAVSLLFGKEPMRVNSESLGQLDSSLSFVNNYQRRLDQIVRAIEVGLMQEQITPESLVRWATQTRIECPADLIALVKSSSPATQETAPENGGLGFASLKNLNWEDITLTLLSGGHIEISARDLKKKAPLGCLGLMNRTTNKPNKLFTLLIAFAESRRGTLKINSKPKDQASDLRKELKAVFSITTNPIPVVDKCWVPRFNLVDKRDAPDKRAKEKASRSTEPFDEHKLSHQRGDSLQGETNSNLGFGPDDDGYTYDEKEDDMAEDEASGWIAKHDG
ncbi:hypothetical protein N9444_05990 [Gammaproteobacteria bacterium]|jgi:hypothetical protein|nr:hypothetical protein [Gammaproteobacteria bacterium]